MENSLKLELAIELLGMKDNHNPSNTIQPVFHYIKEVLNKHNLSPLEAFEILNDIKGAFSPNHNKNVIPFILDYLKSINHELFIGEKEQKVSIVENKTSQLILNLLNNIDEKGWEYIFQNQNDLDLFLKLLTEYFEHKIPLVKDHEIIINKGSKTRFSKVLKEIYHSLSEKPLKSNKEFLELIKVIKCFKDDKNLYVTISR